MNHDLPRTHNFSKTLNFDKRFYKGLDEAINLFFETYVSLKAEYVKKIIHTPKNEVNIYNVKDNYLLNFIRYGLALTDGGLHPSFIEILLINACDVLLDKCENSEKEILRLQLLYVIQSIKMMNLDVEGFVYFTDHVSSVELDTSKIHRYFKI